MEPRASTALTTAGMAALRRAAAMAHTVGGITLRLSAGGEHLVEVRPDPAARPVSVAPRRRPVRLPHGRRPGVGRLRGRPRDRPRRARSRRRARHRLGRRPARPGPRLRRRARRLRRPRRCGRSRRSSTRRRSARWSASLGDGLDDLSTGTVDGLSARLVRDDLLGATVVHVEAGPTGSDAGCSTRCCGGWSPSSAPPSCWTRSPDPRERTAPPGCGDLGGAGAQPGSTVRRTIWARFVAARVRARNRLSSATVSRRRSAGPKSRVSTTCTNGVVAQTISVSHGQTNARAPDTMNTGTGESDIHRSHRARSGVGCSRRSPARCEWASSIVSMPLTNARLSARKHHATGFSSYVPTRRIGNGRKATNARYTTVHQTNPVSTASRSSNDQWCDVQ